MKIAVIGANGFVGNAVCRDLSSRPNIELFPMTRTELDLARPESWKQFPEVDCVVHAASRIDGNTYDIFKTNALTAKSLAEHLNNAGVKKMIYLSTGAVYGPTDEPTHPGMKCLPQGDYAVSKYLAEQETAAAFKGILYILRLYFPYGDGQQSTRLIPSIKSKIEANQAIRCNADGGPRINLTHIDDLTEEISNISTRCEKESKKIYKYNLASDEVIKIETIARIISENRKKNVSFIHSGSSSNCISKPWPDRKFKKFMRD